MLEDTSYIADVSQESKQGQQTAQNISFELSNIENVDATHQNVFEREFIDCFWEPKYIWKTNCGDQTNVSPQNVSKQMYRSPPRTKSRLSPHWSLLMLLAVQSQSQSLTSMKEQPCFSFLSFFWYVLFLMWFVGGVGQVYFILSLFNSEFPVTTTALLYRAKTDEKCNNCHLQREKLFSDLNRASFTVLLCVVISLHWIFCIIVPWFLAIFKYYFISGTERKVFVVVYEEVMLLAP